MIYTPRRRARPSRSWTTPFLVCPFVASQPTPSIHDISGGLQAALHTPEFGDSPVGLFVY